jgi:hypothetical protein
MGRGWSARTDPVGKVRIGVDRKQWIVTQTGRSKRWIRVTGPAARQRRAVVDGTGDAMSSATSSTASVATVATTSTRSVASSISGAAGITTITPAHAIVRCGYTERLLSADGNPNEEMMQVMDESDEVELAFVAGDGMGTLDFVAPGTPRRLLEGRVSGDIVVTVRDPTYRPLTAILAFVENLMGACHCGFFRFGTLGSMVYDARGKVLEISFDTESV